MASKINLGQSPPSDQEFHRILGIDPGLNVTGYAVLETTNGPSNIIRPRICEAGIVRAKSRDSMTARALSKRLAEIHEGITDVIQSLNPTCMALEELYSHYERPKTSILMGHARGVICLAAAQADISVTHYSATQIKKVLTGNGRAPKSQIQLAIARELQLDKPPEPYYKFSDVADALAIALCHYHLGPRKALLAKQQ